jgi:hypothetical protein
MAPLIVLAAWLAASPGMVAPASADAGPAGRAKELYFDRKYAEAREAWRAVLAQAKGADADVAAYWIARSSENLGENERAFREYAEFLARNPADRSLAEEARTSRVSLAAKLYKAGQRQHLSVLEAALKDPSRTVRYFAALQLAGLGREPGRQAVPVLCHIVAEEKDEDLVERAKLALIRVDPSCLSHTSEETAPAAGAGGARWFKIRIFEAGRAEPTVSVNLPVALAELAFKSLPEDARRELRKKGYDADNIWEQLRKLPRAEIVDIRGENHERIQIWIE